MSTPTLPPAGSTYDEAEYPSSPFIQTHPDKLCAMARLFGLDAPDPSQARVLELGCANGANLLPMAQHAPAARFLGIDASSKQIAQGHAAIAATKLTNVELRHQNILDFPASEGKFDYIITHGIFSWVPDEVREKILNICRDHLAETGVAYVSYNAFPGWGMRMALRDMLLFHTKDLPDAKAKVQQARALTAFLAEAVPTENSPYGMLLKQEAELWKGYADNYLRHDILEETNQPFYFHQFMERANRAGLDYLGEASLCQMLGFNLPAKVAETLEKIGLNIVAKEQYTDFVRNRNFRQTLLCHQNASLVRNLTPASLRPFFYTSILQKPEPGPVDFSSGVPCAFALRNDPNLKINADQPFLKAVLATLAECERNRISFDELLAEARMKSAPFLKPDPTGTRAAADEADVANNLLPLYVRGFIDIVASRPRFKTSVAEKPLATPLARYQALHAPYVTSPAHERVPFEITARFVLAACNGENDFNAIVESLLTAAREGKIRLSVNNLPVNDEAGRRPIFMDATQSLLKQILAAGFFTE